MDIGRPMDKYHAGDFFPDIVIHNTIFICGRMVGWETRDPRRVSFGRFSYGFNIVGHLDPLHEVGQAMGLCGC